MSKSMTSEEYLKKHKMRKTPFRIELLELFMSNKTSLTHEEIKHKVVSTKDKVTIYRALDSFEKNGIIHKVPDAKNITRYALCSSNCSHEEHNHDHVHFICGSCKETYCIEEVKVPQVLLPNGCLPNGCMIVVWLQQNSARACLSFVHLAAKRRTWRFFASWL